MSEVLTKALVVKDRKILLLKRSENSSFGGGLWDIPGGKLEFGERPEESLKREINEETSLNIKIQEILDINSGINYEKNKQYITIVYLTKYENGRVILNKENTDFLWVDINNIDEYEKIYYVDDSIRKYIRKGYL
ncbi:NUDIX domain-containing protein [Sporosalibacterium faouarense]|uniref:NUDIX domain-containing protein n=1 Tax=Sporosalibacterium faouarense TaxID=516123 RepID=UPI00141CD043|nr:NUDIX domain-containing protein [Sporosalibacterium faouarense]MTI49223.1 NUDIX domain-containing protein [Bacillota bacterium]